jgi:lipoprotein signal peptidase
MTDTPAPAEPSPISHTPLIARVGWIVVALLTVGLDLYTIPTLYRQAEIGCPDPGPCLNSLQLSASQVAQLHGQGVSLGAIALDTVLLATVPTLVCVALAALIFWRRASDGMALFCAYMLLLFGGARPRWQHANVAEYQRRAPPRDNDTGGRGPN